MASFPVARRSAAPGVKVLLGSDDDKIDSRVGQQPPVIGCRVTDRHPACVASEGLFVEVGNGGNFHPLAVSGGQQVVGADAAAGTNESDSCFSGHVRGNSLYG